MTSKISNKMAPCFVLLCLLIPAPGFSEFADPAINDQIGRYCAPAAFVEHHVPILPFRDTTPPSFTISHIANGDVTILVSSDEDLYSGWVDEKEIWSVGNFDYWWLNTRLAKDPDNLIYAAVKLYQYSVPNSNFDMYVLHNNGDVQDQHLNWNGPGGNPLVVNDPSPNIYLGKPVLDPEGAVDSNNITYVFSGSSNINFTKIAADGSILVSGQTIITGAGAWTNEIRTAIDTHNRVYIVWSNDMHDITYSYSDDGGDTWADATSICYNPSQQLNKPQICCDGNDNVHIIWQHWTGVSNLLAYMKLRPDGSISIDESFLTQSNNQVWSPYMDIDEEDNLHVVWAKSSQQINNAYYTKINGNLDGGGQPLSDDELSIIQEQAFLTSQLVRYPKCVVDDYQNIHTVFERGQYGCNHPKAVHHKKMNSIPLLRIECPGGSVMFVQMTGSGSEWEGTFTPPETGTYMVKVSGSDASGNTGVGDYEFEYGASGVEQNGAWTGRGIALRSYPNPGTLETLVRYYTDRATSVSVEVYDARGQLVRILLKGRIPAGEHRTVWDGRDNEGNSVASGTYFCRVAAGGEITAQRITIIR
ncbi:MAG: T9SS type A sorting domain-containing protein [Candidatus Eisenbacteria sp.]|nr:T9SS type A sorting domain-containing protein [Candidatus Eisenbacteria bacterium]